MPNKKDEATISPLDMEEPIRELPPDDSGPQFESISNAVSRRRFLGGLAAAVGTLAMGGDRAWAASRSVLPRPKSSGIKHVVVVMMENRSFDHFLGWVPGADGKQADLTYIDSAGVPHNTYPLAPDYQGCGHSDPDHSYQGGRVEYDNGACDGWLRAGLNDIYSIGYYTQNDLRFHGKAVPSWTTFDRYFAAIMAETFPNRIYQHAAQTDRLDNSTTISTLPTIWDRLAARDVEGRYYYSDIPVLALWGAKYLSISRPFTQFLIDCITDNLPAVSFVDPRFQFEEEGLSNDDHPHADIRNGQAFLNLVYKAVTLSRAWPHTVLVVNYDEWGGFFDHVAPPVAPIPAADMAAGNADGRLGFRVPTLLVSPWARSGYVSNAVYDHTSILRMIEWRWDLQPLTVRDAMAGNLADELDFTQRRRFAPQFSVPAGPFGSLCALTGATSPEGAAAPIAAPQSHWRNLQALAQSYGW